MKELITQRAEDYINTNGFTNFNGEVEDAIQAIKEGQVPKDDLGSCITNLWVDAFVAGYKAEMLDVTAAMAFNKAEITAVKYLKEA